MENLKIYKRHFFCISYGNFVYKIQTIFNECFPMRKIKYNGSTSGENPWLNTFTIKFMKTKKQIIQNITNRKN